MILKPGLTVIDPDSIVKSTKLYLKDEEELTIDFADAIAYSPLINAHDHLIGNWVPRAGDNRPYQNSHIWVEDMRQSFSFQERNVFWLNDGSFDLMVKEALLLGQLGAYKNLFSGCGTVQDHAPNQVPAYYNAMPINVLPHFRQCHSITLGNWWGGGSPEEELKLAEGKMPFIIHLGEGTDEVTKGEFALLEERGLLKENTLMIHGIAFTEEELKRIAKAKASLCWCPASNFYLIGETMKVEAALKLGVNVVLGTDSTMSGSTNLIAEMAFAHEQFPSIELKELYRMVTQNAAKALYLHPRYAKVNPNDAQNILIIDQQEKDPFENLITSDMASIQLLIVDGIPRYGDSIYLDDLPANGNEYTIFRTGKREKFVIGDPLEINEIIDDKLGYHKDFPYLPF